MRMKMHIIQFQFEFKRLRVNNSYSFSQRLNIANRFGCVIKVKSIMRNAHAQTRQPTQKKKEERQRKNAEKKKLNL